MLRKRVSVSEDDDDDDDDDEDKNLDNKIMIEIASYDTRNSVSISGTRTAQSIMDYVSTEKCLVDEMNSSPICIRRKTVNHRTQEDITSENTSKKYKHHADLAPVLDTQGELDQACLPIRPDRCLTIDDTSDDESSEKVSIETIEKQIPYFPHTDIDLSTPWYLYKINISNSDALGFVVPCERMKLPMFNLNRRGGKLKVKVVYLKSIYWEEYRNQLEDFSRYLVEKVFDDINAGFESMLKFDVEQSTFKLFPCLLNKSGDIDCQRMVSICNRRNKRIQNPSELMDDELYYLWHLPEKIFYQNISDVSLSKRASDRWEHKKASETIESYADHFEYKIPDIHVRRDCLMATMKSVRKPRINYLKNSSKMTKKESSVLSTKPDYFPIELLRYAPLNQTDLELISKLPSVLVRISQLYRIEQLRKRLADSIQCYSLLNVEQMPIVTFNDCLIRAFSSLQSTSPLDFLNYDFLSENNCTFQPSPGLLFQSITRRSVDENTDMENLEILGDCFLKLAMSMSLYHQYPLDDTGKLTLERDKQVSNENLYQISVLKDLKKYLNYIKIDFDDKNMQWTRLGCTTDKMQSEGQTKEKKLFADMIEALIGAFLISTNYMTTIKFMKWLGLDVIPLDERNQVMKTPSILRENATNNLEEMISNVCELYEEHLFIDIEKTINYKFKDKAYLIAAFTFPSSSANRLTICYKRLKFLGDAVFNFLITRHIFLTTKSITPGGVTKLRQERTKKDRLAKIVVEHCLHTKIIHNMPHLDGQIKSYLDDDTFSLKDRSMKDKLSKNISQRMDSAAQKALADVFVALVGAIFLDSGYSLNIVWKVIEPLLRQYINKTQPDACGKSTKQ